MTTDKTFTTALLSKMLNSKIPLFIMLLSIFSGLLALNFTPREEEPQIVVPMIDVIVDAPGISARQVERLVTTPLEKLLSQVTGVEHVYSVSNNNHSVVTLRFTVGENRERALLNTYNKLHSNTEVIPAVVKKWRVKPIEVDDVPIVMLALYSKDKTKVDDFALRRLAQEVSTHLQTISNASEVKVFGGRSREVQVNINPEQMAARKVSINDIINALDVSNVLQSHGNLTLSNTSIAFESGDVYRDINVLKQTPVSVIDASVILLKDIATVTDGPAEQSSYSWLDFSTNQPPLTNSISNTSVSESSSDLPMVTISVAKQQGSNAVEVAKAVHNKINKLQNTIFPESVKVEVLRDYGKTANDKVNDLTTSLAFAVFTVVVFIGVFLGWRSALVVGLAVPICYGITLSLDLVFGYTINRVTLFALILSLGLLVDDPITGVDNIERYFTKLKGKANKKAIQQSIVNAVNEIRIPLLLSTLTIVLAFIPLAFITGMMGPYMAPMAFNVPLSVISSTLVAFLVTPWLAAKFIRPKTQQLQLSDCDKTEPSFQRFYRKLLTPLLDSKAKGKALLVLVFILFVLAALLPVMRWVPLKLLPFDNKNELQVIIDMPEHATLEQTAAIAKRVSTMVQKLPEVTAVASYVGLPSPIDFNGMVRQYYQRHAPYLADLRIILIEKDQREHQSHGVVLRLREQIRSLNSSLNQMFNNELNQHLMPKGEIKIRVVEVPPGPPVLSTLVAEVYGNEFTPYQQLQQAAQIVEQRFKAEPHVVEVDTTVGGEQMQLRFVSDKTKAALSGISTNSINQTLNVATKGKVSGYLHVENEAAPLAINLKLPLTQRQSLNDLKRLTVKGQAGIVQTSTPQGIDMAPQPIVSLGELGEFTQQAVNKAIFHKDLRPVVYVTADISGRTPGEVIADMSSDLIDSSQQAEVQSSLAAKSTTNTLSSWQNRSFINNGGGDAWNLPEDIELSFSGEGEWRITIRVFRDMGLAFAFALTAIFIVLRIQTGSAALSGIIMSAIPLTVIGIMPGFFLLNQFGERTIAGAPEPILFTATAMIGMIALAGIVVRNSLILIEFISQAQQRGETIKESLIQAGAVRMRPVLLTAGTTLLGNLIITLDPVFSGLAIAIIFGIISSTIFTLLVVPIVYSLVFDNRLNSSNKTAKEQS